MQPELMVVQLAGELSDARRRLDLIEEAGYSGKLDDLRKQIADLAEQINALKPAEDKPRDAAVPDWSRLDREQARVWWDRLAEWGRSVLHPMYARPVWRPCWYKHPALRMQLTWLMATWLWAYEPGSPPTRVAEWHTRWLPYVLGVIEREFDKCGPESEQLPQPRHRAVEGPESERAFVDSPEALTRWVEGDCARRPEPARERPTQAD